MESAMTGSAAENVVDFPARRARPQEETTSCLESRQETVDVFSMAFFGFWPGIVWLPLPFDPRAAEHDGR
jgi:hypothetical protein